MDAFEIKFKSAFRNLNFAILLCAMLFALCFSVEAQQSRKLPRLAILSARSPGPLEIFDAFHQRLRDLGYIEGKNIIIEYRFAEEKYDRLPALMAELMSLKPDVIFTHTTPGAIAARKATTTIPVVIGAAGDLVELGIVASLARPGGNITGMTFVTLEITNGWSCLKRRFQRSLGWPFWSIQRILFGTIIHETWRM
jgi:putative tryptophan/tyrosine transport system substrate-binding protein